MNKKLRKEKISKTDLHNHQCLQHIACYSNGITLVALIITIIVLLILAVVTIRAVTGDGILAQARNARDKWEEAQRNEEIALDQLNDSLNGQTTTGYNEEKKVNVPELKTGMVPVKYVDNNWVVTTKDDPEWYNYSDTELKIGDKTVEAKKWANVMLQDNLVYNETTKVVETEGSMFVWIPRFAYKLTQLTEDDYTEAVVTSPYQSTVTEKAGTIEVEFLQGNTDYYGTEKATRGAGKSETEYVVHPSFTSDVNLGGWDRELTGYWVAKFEAAYSGQAGNSNSADDSPVTYTNILGWNPNSNEGQGASENITTNYYGTNAKGNAIKYPTFTGNRSSFNYISIGDSYSLCLNLNANNNPYKLDNSSDPHLMKNSEWGAVAYLSHSKYGKNGAEISCNSNTSVNDESTNGQRTVWASTGGGNYKANTAQSSTGTIYGIYDLNGGVWERVASYVNNNNPNINTYGASMKVESSTKYVTLYKKGTTDERVPNYIANKDFYGDAVAETSRIDESKAEATNKDYYYNYYASWYHDYSYFPVGGSLFFVRGGSCWSGAGPGSFAFHDTYGTLDGDNGFRAVLV